MARYSYHASHEQFTPSQLVALSRLAERHRFDAVFSSDHLQPWSPSQGQSGHVWTWLGAALQATNHIAFGTITVPGGWRYHPVHLAQSIATLCELFPGRVPWLALGSGEALNEAVFGQGWPDKEERERRLLAGARMLIDLLQGQPVDSDGPIRARQARIWVRPQQLPRLFGAAMTPATARWVGGWADGLLTLGSDLDKLSRIIEAFREGGGEGKPVHVKLDTCQGIDVPAARREAHAQWRFACVGLGEHHDLRTPQAFDEAARLIQPHDMDRHVLMWRDPGVLVEHAWACVKMGAQAIDFQHVGLNQQLFIQTLGADVIPALRLRQRRSPVGA